MAEEEGEPGLSRSGLNKLIKESIPSIRVANDSRELLYQACVEFIRVVGGEANRISAEEQKKTIGHEHIFKALENLGMGQEYIEAGQGVLEECKEQAARRLQRQNSRLDKCGIPEEELLRQQQELINQARMQQAEAEQQELARFQAQIIPERRVQEEDGSEDYDAED